MGEIEVEPTPLDADAIKAIVERAKQWIHPQRIIRATAINEEHLALDVLDLVNHIIGLAHSLDDALGPHCTSCGNSIDPDVCWCGDYAKSHSGYDGHSFVAMGCDCSRHERDWKKLASSRGHLLWQTMRERDELKKAVDGLTLALTAIADDAHQSYDAHGPSSSDMDRQYKIGIADGHRCAGNTARKALGRPTDG